MSEWLKIALKAALVVIMMVVVWGVLTQFQFIPSFAFTSEMIEGIAFAKAVFSYWYPGFGGFIALCFSALAVDLAVILLQLTLNLTKWLYQIFE